MATTTNLNSLVINYLTQAQYDAAAEGGTINENQLYFTPPEQMAAVAKSGNYNDLSNKPTFATVATSGSYNDLSNKPSVATTTNDGLMAATDKVAVDKIGTGDIDSQTYSTIIPFINAVNNNLQKIYTDFYTGTSNPSYTDLNDIYVTSGFYAIGGDVSTYANKPENSHGSLIVFRTGSYFVQFFLAALTNNLYYRYSDGTGYQAWQKLANITYSTTDLTAGSSVLTTGQVYLVYE